MVIFRSYVSLPEGTLFSDNGISIECIENRQPERWADEDCARGSSTPVALLRPRVRLLRHSVHQGYTNFPFKNIPYTGLQPTNFQPSGIELVEET